MQEKETKVAIEKFGSKIRDIRATKKMSQEDLGFRTGLDRTYISGIERGERNLSLKNIIKISSALEYSISELFE